LLLSYSHVCLQVICSCCSNVGCCGAMVLRPLVAQQPLLPVEQVLPLLLLRL